jgi:hypothetical protein
MQEGIAHEGFEKLMGFLVWKKHEALRQICGSSKAPADVPHTQNIHWGK